MNTQASVGRREQGKTARRDALIAAARRILMTSDLSMRRLAEEAGVAEATPYNLFGSKRGLIAELYADQRRQSEARLVDIDDPIVRLYRAIDLLAEDLAAQPHFHRALYGAVYQRSERATASHLADPGVAFWMTLVEAATHQFRSDVRVDLFARCFVHFVTGTMLDWSDARIDASEWRAITRHGLTLMARDAVCEEARDTLPADH